MDLHDAATYFDDDPVVDGYTGAALFHAQSSSFDDSSSDGATARRRVLSLGPGIVMPTRRVLSLYGERWLVGNGSVDGFQGEAIRQHFVMKKATDLMALLTPGEALAAAAGTSVYVHKAYFKEVVNTLVDAEYDSQFNIFIAPGEPAAKASFFRDADGRLYHVRNDYLPVEGLRVCQSDILDTGARNDAVFDGGTVDPVTEARTGGSPTVSSIWLDMPKFYRFRAMSDDRIQPGDIAVFVPTSITPVQGQTFTLLGRKWRVVTVQAEEDCWAIHARSGA